MTHVVTVRSGTLAHVPGRSRERPETGWRVPGQTVRASRDAGQFGRRSGRVKRPGTARSVPGRVGRPGTPTYPSRLALIRAPGFAVRNWMKHVPGRSGRPGTVAGVQDGPSVTGRPMTVRDAVGVRGRPDCQRRCCARLARVPWPCVAFVGVDSRQKAIRWCVVSTSLAFVPCFGYSYATSWAY